MFARQVFQVSDSIWCVRRPSYYTCSYGVRTPRGIVLIDAGMDSSGADVDALLCEMQSSVENLRGLLITHWHNDHAAGARVTAERSGCDVYYSQADGPWLTRTAARGGLRGWLAKRVPERGIGVLLIGLLGEAVPEAVLATRYLQDGETLFDDFEVIATPGHTPGHASFFYRPEQTLFAGDALASIDGKVRFMARPVTLDVTTARKSMQKCLSRDIGLLCPGHREPLTRNVANACARMREYLADGKKWPFFG